MIKDSLVESLNKFFNFQSFRSGQLETIQRILANQDCLVVMPTGGGKSLCYQLPALMQSGVTLVISPLIALMKDQVDQLQAKNLPATFINSSLDLGEQKERMWKVKNGSIKLLYIAPERFKNSWFRDQLAEVKVELLAVDEAHCISQWGHDFRPDYLRLAQVADSLDRPPIIALTATATPEVQDDIIDQLKLKDPFRQVTGFHRPNLILEVISAGKRKDKDLHLVDRLTQSKGSNIVYAGTRKNVEDVLELCHFMGIPSTVGYHAGMSDDARHQAQERFLSGQTQTIIATNAFGMGVDKKDIRQVIHYNFPGTVEAYYQEVGRAGRDGKPSKCTLLFSYQDRYLREFFIEGNFPPKEAFEAVYRFLQSRRDGPIHLSPLLIKDNMSYKLNEMGITSILRVFRTQGIIASGNKELPWEITFLKPRNYILENLKRSSLQKETMLYLDKTSPNYDGPFKVFLFHMEKETGLNHDQTKRALSALESKGLLQYHAPPKGRDLSLIDKTRAFKDLEIDYSIIEAKRRLEYEKLEWMIRFSEEFGCRHRYLLNYFGEPFDLENCGACDQCLNKNKSQSPQLPPSEEELIVIKKILSAVARLEGNFGASMAAKVLKGSKDKNLINMNLDKLTTYGLLPDFSIEFITKMIHKLIEKGLCSKVDKVFSRGGKDQTLPMVELTDFGHSIMVGKACPVRSLLTIIINSPEKQPVKSKTEKLSSHREPFIPSPLFEHLRKVRRELSEKEQKPPYFIFSDSVLKAMASLKPQTKDELKMIKGVGDNKIKTYGSIFLDAIKSQNPS